MKEISLKTPRPYGQRTKYKNRFLSIKKKYFLVVEGSKTEIEYFNGIFDSRRELGIDMLVDIIILDRDEKNKTDSHPNHLLSGVLRKLNEPNNNINYNKEIDEIWLIFDRDPESLSEKQFNKINSVCIKNGFNIGFTNPNFEFWLLLHLPNIEKYNRDILLENKKINKKKRFIEKELAHRLDNGYSKNNIQFDRFKESISLAIEQEKLFEEETVKILDKLGSNIGILISKMKNDK